MILSFPQCILLFICFIFQKTSLSAKISSFAIFLLPYKWSPYIPLPTLNYNLPIEYRKSVVNQRSMTLK